MSDLADAVFGGQLLGHAIAGEELTTSVIADAAIQADLASHLFVDGELSPVEHQVLEAKVASHIATEGSCDVSTILQEGIETQIACDIADSLLS